MVYTSPNTWAWYTPSLEDFVILSTAAFVILSTAAFAVGKPKQEKASGIASLHPIVLNQYTVWKKNRGDKKDIVMKILQSLKHTIMLLLHHPLTSHDLIAFIAEAQWTFLDIHAYLDFIKVLMPRLLFIHSQYDHLR